MQHLNEETKEFQKLRKEWLDFRPQNEQDLFNFIHHIMNDYGHDYGTSIHSVVAMMKAVLEYANNELGFTGFQVGCMAWQIWKDVFDINDRIGMRYQKYEELLYPQYMKKFRTLEISKDQHERLIDLAKNNLENEQYACKSVIRHWNKIASGWLPKYIIIKD